MSNKVPQIRFNGYSDAWVQRKFSDLYKKNLERNKEQFGSDRTISIATMRFKEEGNGASEDSLASYKVLREGDVAFEGHTSKQFAFGRFVLNDIGDGIMSPRFTTLRPTQDMPIAFWKQYIHYEPIMRYPIVNSTKLGTMMNELVVNEFLNQSVLVPSVAEQLKIGQFLTLVDNLIAANQRKVDLLKEQKKGYLQKMFPKNGAKVPELRFAGFADDWEERKLGDLLKEFSIKSKIEDEHKVLSSTNSGMEFREGRVSGTSNLGYKIIKNGDLVLSPQNLWLGNININNIGKGLVSPSYKTFEFINIDSSFINPQLRTQKMLEEYKNSSTQGASVVRRNLEIDSFYQIKIFVPTISEQEKIGSFFKQLDNTIDLHQRKLDLLKEQKKGFLQKMFV